MTDHQKYTLEEMIAQEYTLEAMIACVRRELAMRKNVYPKWVQSGRMKAEEADHQINCMQAVHDTLSGLPADVADFYRRLAEEKQNP